MVLIPSVGVVSAISVFHLTLAYYLLTFPNMIASHSFVVVLGEAMGFPQDPSFASRSGVNALLAAVLGILGISDLTAAALPAEVSAAYWSSQAPVRLVCFFGLIGYTYLSKPGGMMAAGKSHLDVSIRGPGDYLKNSVVFSWAFVEMLAWFWIFVILRDERLEAKERSMRKKDAERNML